jgi:hypothetical protein
MMCSIPRSYVTLGDLIFPAMAPGEREPEGIYTSQSSLVSI